MSRRDPYLRDLHFDLPWEWQSQYVSPNEGGSGNTTPLYIDFCFMLLGWPAPGQIKIERERERERGGEELVSPVAVATFSTARQRAPLRTRGAWGLWMWVCEG